MMLRSRKASVNVVPTQENIGPLKRHAAVIKDEPKRKRGGLSDLSNVMSNTLCIDSTKKILDKPITKGTLKSNNTGVFCVNAINEKKLEKHESKKTTREEKLFPLLEVEVDQENASQDLSGKSEVSESDPCPDFDYDAGNAGDHFLVPEYAFDIFKYYLHRENEFVISDFATRQPRFTKKTRAVLVDWMVEMQESFELNHETLYTAIKIMDIYVDRTPVKIQSQDLQLLGSAAVFLSSKFEERCPPLIEDFLCIFANDFTHDEMLSMERTIFRAIGFDVGYPLAYRFLRRYSKVLQLDMPTLTLARYYLETCALFYEFVGVSDSLMGAACLLLALRVKKLNDWNPVLVKYTGYCLEEVEPLMWAINHTMIMRPKIYPNCRVSFVKYTSEVFFEVAKLPFLEDRFDASQPVGPPPGLGFKTQ